jgi:MFS family permease
MGRYQDNAKWLQWMAPFKGMSISAAYLTPFFLQHGLSLNQMFQLQAIYSLAVLAWELPSGWLADRLGRAISIKVSGPIAAASVIAYGFSSHWWQFVACEVGLAISNGLISGVDDALLADSLKAEGRDRDFEHLRQRIKALGYIATAAAVPLSLLLVGLFGSIDATLVADGATTAIGWACFAMRLSEPDLKNSSQEDERKSLLGAMLDLGHNPQARWLTVLGTALATSTYLAFWLTTPYFQELGVAPVWFGSILAGRSLLKAWLSFKFRHTKRFQPRYLLLTALAGLGLAAMATGNVWLVGFVFGHDVIQALSESPITARLQRYIPPEHRAALNSAVNLVTRLGFSLAGLSVGWLVSHVGLGDTFAVFGLASTVVAALALLRLRQLQVA